MLIRLVIAVFSLLVRLQWGSTVYFVTQHIQSTIQCPINEKLVCQTRLHTPHLATRKFTKTINLLLRY